jgi:hypothetical protein
LLDPELPAAASLPAVSGPIKEYLRGRRDTIKCIVVCCISADILMGDIWQQQQQQQQQQ